MVEVFLWSQMGPLATAYGFLVTLESTLSDYFKKRLKDTVIQGCQIYSAILRASTQSIFQKYQAAGMTLFHK